MSKPKIVFLNPKAVSALIARGIDKDNDELFREEISEGLVIKTADNGSIHGLWQVNGIEVNYTKEQIIKQIQSACAKHIGDISIEIVFSDVDNEKDKQEFLGMNVSSRRFDAQKLAVRLLDLVA